MQTLVQPEPLSIETINDGHATETTIVFDKAELNKFAAENPDSEFRVTLEDGRLFPFAISIPDYLAAR